MQILPHSGTCQGILGAGQPSKCQKPPRQGRPIPQVATGLLDNPHVLSQEAPHRRLDTCPMWGSLQHPQHPPLHGQ